MLTTFPQDNDIAFSTVDRPHLPVHFVYWCPGIQVFQLKLSAWEEFSLGPSYGQMALQSEHHLACIDGPDRGAVIPLNDGLVVGRGPHSGLHDPTLSRAHCRVELPSRSHRHSFLRKWRKRPVAYLHDLSATNPLRPSLGASFAGVEKTLSKSRWQRGYPLLMGGSVRLGRGTWAVRQRPSDLRWPFPAKKIQGRRPLGNWMRVLPLLMLAFLLTRFLPGWRTIILGIFGAVAVGSLIFLGWRRHQRRQYFDPAFLHLAVLSEMLRSAREVNPVRQPISIWLNRWGRKTVSLQPGSDLGVVGPNAHGDARWIATQVWLDSPSLAWFDDSVTAAPTAPDIPWLWIRRPSGSEKEPSVSTPPGTIVVAWADSTRRLPPTTRQIVTPQTGLSPKWLSPLDSDPSLANTVGTSIPDSFGYDALGISTEATAIKERWERFRSTFPNGPEKLNWAVPVGLLVNASTGTREVFSLDLEKMGPHGLIAGGTGSGKSVALRAWLWSLALHIPPTSLRLLIIDYKGGAGLGKLAALPHVEQFSTDLQAMTTGWLLRRLKQVLQRRKRELLAAGFADLSDWETSRHAKPAPPRLLVVIDEFQTLGEEHPQLLDSVTRLATQGRSLGLHLLLATQRPGHTVNANLRATLDLRIALHCVEIADSVAIRGDDKASLLPRVPGRALHEDAEFQFMLPDEVDIAVFKQATSTNESSQSLWPIPLPLSLPTTELKDRYVKAVVDPVGVPLGLYEGVTDCGSLIPLGWKGEPVLFAGPGSTSAELAENVEDLGLLAASHHRLPAYLIGENTRQNEGWEAVIDPSDAGACSWVLSRLLSHGNVVLVICEVGGVMQELDFRGVGLEASMIWDQLLSQAKRRRIQLVTSETRGNRKVSRIPLKLFRLPHGSAWTDPALLPLLPSLVSFGEGSGDYQVPSREETISPIKGRVLATGFSDLFDGALLPPTMVQLPEPLKNASEIPPVNSDNILEAARAGFLRFNDEKIRVMGASHSQLDWVRKHTQPGTTLTEMDSTQWLTTIQDSKTPLLIGFPPLELLRYLSSRHPLDELWLKANYPYTADLLIFRHENEVLLLQSSS